MEEAVIVEVQAEATSEKGAIGHWLDGRASLVIGTRTQCLTAETQILSKGTVQQCDVGMCCYYISIIGMQKYEPV